MAKRRVDSLSGKALAAVMLAAAAPLAAQTAPATTNSATPAPSPTAPADGTAIGPPQLRDFTLNGTVTRRAEPVTTAPAPAASRPRPSAGQTQAAPQTEGPRRTDPPVAGPDRDVSVETSVVDLPPPSPVESPDSLPTFDEAQLPATMPAQAPVEEGSSWPWPLAALAAVLGAAFLLWRRRQSGQGGYAYAGVSELAGPEPAPATPPPLPRAAAPRQPGTPAPRSPAPKPAPKPQGDGAIVASGLRPKLGFELRPIRAETDDQRGAALLFDVIVINSGHAPARDVLVEAQLINAGPQQDEQIGRFFREPVGQGERLPVIAPMGRVSLKTRLSIPGDKMTPIEIDGRQLFVPLVAFNALYRWSGGEEQDSASFLVGRGKEEGGKMAPFRLDQGAKSWSGLSARPHSAGLQR